MWLKMVEMNLISVGTLIIVIGFVFVFVGILSQTKGKAKVEGGGIVFIGPIPVLGAFTSERAFYILIAISIVFFLVFMALNYLKVI